MLLILAVDHFLDMGRSATNVVGNAVASTVVARWEGTLDPLRTRRHRAAATPRRTSRRWRPEAEQPRT